ncbi:MAG: hypothetical protein GY795_37480 [Desulfobacterales bacterium]|nr:hypothetical protein [Desulfobacterales bacterium]
MKFWQYTQIAAPKFHFGTPSKVSTAFQTKMKDAKNSIWQNEQNLRDLIAERLPDNEYGMVSNFSLQY